VLYLRISFQQDSRLQGGGHPQGRLPRVETNKKREKKKEKKKKAINSVMMPELEGGRSYASQTTY
jgi:hypothetical protein